MYNINNEPKCPIDESGELINDSLGGFKLKVYK